MSSEAVAAINVSTDNFKSLEDKVYRTIELLKAAREGKAAAERDAARLLEQLEQREDELKAARDENVSLRKEREEVRGRVEKLMTQIDEITAEAQ
jgi:phage shock protein A